MNAAQAIQFRYIFRRYCYDILFLAYIRMVIIGRSIGIDDRKSGDCIDSDIRGMHDYREICDCVVEDIHVNIIINLFIIAIDCAMVNLDCVFDHVFEDLVQFGQMLRRNAIKLFLC